CTVSQAGVAKPPTPVKHTSWEPTGTLTQFSPQSPRRSPSTNTVVDTAGLEVTRKNPVGPRSGTSAGVGSSAATNEPTTAVSSPATTSTVSHSGAWKPSTSPQHTSCEPGTSNPNNP